MENKEKMKKMYVFFAIAVTIFAVLVDGLQLLNTYVLAPKLGIDVEGSSWFSLVNMIIPMYVIGFPLLFLAMSKKETLKPEKHKLSFGRYLLCIPLMAGMIGVGAFVGIILNMLVTLPFGVNPMNSTAISKVMMDSNPVLRTITAGILAPVVEEMIFRKFLIDRTYRYGEWVAIFTSGVMFGLFHGNFAQCFFAALIGGLFAYIYVRTGQIWYTIGLHMILNLTTSVITMALAKPYLSVDPEMLTEYQQVSMQYLTAGGDPALEQKLMSLAEQIVPKMVPYLLWTGFLGQICFVGIVLWIIFLVKKKFTLKAAPDQLEKGGMKCAWINVGMLVFIIYCIITFVMNYVMIVSEYGGQFSV